MSEGHLVNGRDGGDEDDDVSERFVDADTTIQNRGILYAEKFSFMNKSFCIKNL